MFFLGIIFFTIVVVTIWYFVAKRRSEYGTVNVNENELIKKFNRVVKRLTERNIEDVKADLFKILDRYSSLSVSSLLRTAHRFSRHVSRLMSRLSRQFVHVQT